MNDRQAYRHATQVRVRNYEIDWQGIVHNAVYLHYFEIGRVSYLQALGIQIDVNTIQHENRVVVARNEIDYRSPARFEDTLTVLTRISELGETSFLFEGLIEQAGSLKLVAENRSVHVWLDAGNSRPITLPGAFIKTVIAFEGRSCSIRPK